MENFSVLLSVYYKENPKFLVEALDSIINQTVQSDDIVLVEDGPLTDDLNKCIEKYKNDYKVINVVKLEKNQGLGIALSKGLLECKNDIVARMDTDDIADKNRFEIQYNYLINHKECSIIGSNINEFNDSVLNPICSRNLPENDLEIKKYMKKRCPFNHMTVMFRKDDVLKAGNYIDLHYNEDYYLWVRMAKLNMNFHNIQLPLVNARVDTETYQRRGGYKYFESENKLFQIMLKNKQINIFTYLYNITLRFVIELCIPNSLRKFIFINFGRKKNNGTK